MLEYLRIRDLALIEDMELDFAPGLNVLTGETGAGKSFILKALGFLLGDRLTSDIIRPGAERAQVEGVFMLGDTEYVLRRELVMATGRSRLFINDGIGSQETLKGLRERAILHTSQHAQQKLLQPAWQAALLESALPSPALCQERDNTLKELHEIANQRLALEQKIQHLTERRDVLELQQSRIDAVNPQLGEEDTLEAHRAAAKEASQRARLQTQALALIYGDDGPGLLDLATRLERVLEQLESTHIAPQLEAVSALRHNLPELERYLRRPANIEVDLDALEARLYALSQLKRALRRPLDDIVLLRDEIVENLSFLDSCGLDIARLHKEETSLIAKLRATLEELIPARRKAAASLTASLQTELTSLGFSSQVRVIPDFTPFEIWPGVNDEKGRLLFAPNLGQSPQALDRIASGGELSRFLLALVGVQSVEEYATYIFDEVDAGVGGLTLRYMAERLHQFAAQRQVLLITHWPLLAAQAERHFYVSKIERDDATFTLCTPLSASEREIELTRMAGGP